MGELEILTRAHDLFASASRPAAVAAGIDHLGAGLRRASQVSLGSGQERYRAVADAAQQSLQRMTATDRELAAILASAQQDHAHARERTAAVLEAARADTATPLDSPVAQREAMRRTVE
ncbi:MAG: NlpC/P60 family protein, partial [Mycobacterium sp.]